MRKNFIKSVFLKKRMEPFLNNSLISIELMLRNYSAPTYNVRFLETLVVVICIIIKDKPR